MRGDLKDGLEQMAMARAGKVDVAEQWVVLVDAVEWAEAAGAAEEVVVALMAVESENLIGNLALTKRKLAYIVIFYRMNVYFKNIPCYTIRLSI